MREGLGEGTRGRDSGKGLAGGIRGRDTEEGLGKGTRRGTRLGTAYLHACPNGPMHPVGPSGREGQEAHRVHWAIGPRGVRQAPGSPQGALGHFTTGPSTFRKRMKVKKKWKTIKKVTFHCKSRKSHWRALNFSKKCES